MSSGEISTAEAAIGINVRPTYEQYFQCDLTQNRDAEVTIAMFPANPQVKNYSVRMTDERGNVIWEENGALSWNGKRTFKLGNDHKVYRIYIKSNGGSGVTASAEMTEHRYVQVKAR